MPGQPSFTHIHCSSRFDRSAASLETALDGWMADSSLITLTEVATGNRAARLREKGWGHWVASEGGRSDDAGIAWEKKTWRSQEHWARKLHRGFQGLPAGLWCSDVLLKHTGSGHTLIVSCSHLPAHVNGPGGFVNIRNEPAQVWAARKEAYQQAMTAWSVHVRDIMRRKRPNALLVCGDFNVSFKDNWFRDYMNQHWKDLDLALAWKHFPTEGGTLGGSRIIDGSWYHGMSTEGAVLMAHTGASDHRPYKETFTLGKTEPREFYDPASGHIRPGREWWGFGDYAFDEMFENKPTKDADGNIIVTFDFSAMDPSMF